MFFITAFGKAELTDDGWFDGGDVRTVGYKDTLEKAEKALVENVCNIHDGIYNYAVIEEIGPGIYPDVKQEIWFGWDEEKQRFYRINKPEPANRSCNFAFG